MSGSCVELSGFSLLLLIIIPPFPPRMTNNWFENKIIKEKKIIQTFFHIPTRDFCNSWIGAGEEKKISFRGREGRNKHIGVEGS